MNPYSNTCFAMNPYSNTCFADPGLGGMRFRDCRFLGTPVVPFFPFLFGGLLVKAEYQEQGYPCYQGVAGEPRIYGFKTAFSEALGSRA